MCKLGKTDGLKPGRFHKLVQTTCGKSRVRRNVSLKALLYIYEIFLTQLLHLADHSASLVHLHEPPRRGYPAVHRDERPRKKRQVSTRVFLHPSQPSPSDSVLPKGESGGHIQCYQARRRTPPSATVFRWGRCQPRVLGTLLNTL